MASRSVDEVAAVLYALEPSAFVAARTDAVRAARDAGDRELAMAIGKLRRPAQAAWAVNLLAREDVDGLAKLLSLGEQLREAQQQLRGEALQRLGRQRHEMIAALTRQAQRLASDSGHPLGAGAIQQVTETLGAAIADPESAGDVRHGRLVTPLSYAGFGPGAASSQSAHGPTAPLEDEPRHGRDQLAQARRDLILVKQDAQRAAEELNRCEDAVADARRTLDSAAGRRDAAARGAQLAERTLRDAESRAQRLAEQLGEPPSG